MQNYDDHEIPCLRTANRLRPYVGIPLEHHHCQVLFPLRGCRVPILFCQLVQLIFSVI